MAKTPTASNAAWRSKEAYKGLKEVLLSSVFWGSIPLLVVLSGGKENPFLFAAIYSGCTAVALFVYLRCVSKWVPSREYLRAVFAVFLNRKKAYDNKGPSRSAFNIFNVRSFLIPFRWLGILLLTWSFRYIHETVGAVLFEIWPIFFVVLQRRLNEDYYISRRGLLFNGLAFLAVGFVVSSNAQATVTSALLSPEYVFGIAALLFTILTSIQQATRQKQGEHIAKNRLRGGGHYLLLS